MTREIASLPRRVALKVLVGSWNYNLQSENSDKDYKLFVLPEFDDLYNKVDFSTPNIVTDTVDYDVHDIRQLPKLLWGANINYMEVLFAGDAEFPCFTRVPSQLGQIIAMRDNVMRMNIPKFYASCLGTYRQKMLLLNKGTVSTQILVDKFGYDCKQACDAYRVVDAAIRFYKTDFTDFRYAIRYDDNDPTRKLLLDIKAGLLKESDFHAIVELRRNELIHLGTKFDSHHPDEYVRDHINGLIRDTVEKYIKGKYTHVRETKS